MVKGWLKRNFIIVPFILIILSLGVFSITDKQIPGNILGGKELSSPGDWIKEEQIQVYKDKVILEVQNPLWAAFTNTNSMDPFIDETAHAIEISPADGNAINVGDVISYQTSYGVLIHRVIEKGEDNQGLYYIVKGDNNSLRDPFKVRFSDVKGVVVAVIY